MERHTLRLLLAALFWLCCQHLANAQTKTPVPESDYHLWGTLYYDNTSPSGKWVSFVMRYAEHPDTLYVRHTTSGKHYKFPSADAGRFLKDQAFAFQTGDTLTVLDLDRGTRKTIPAVNKWDITSNGLNILVLDQQGKLKAQDQTGKTLWETTAVSLFAAAPNGTSVIYAQGNKAILQNIPANAAPLVLATASAPFQSFSWSTSGKALAFMNDEAGKVGLWYYETGSKKLTCFDTALLPDTYTMASPATSRLTVSNDGKKVFFGMKGDWQNQLQDKPVVEVWNGNDEFIYPERQKKKGWHNIPRMAVWWPNDTRTFAIGSQDRALVAFEGNQDYAITWSLTTFGPQYRLFPQTNIFVTNLATGITHPAINDVESGYGQISISPYGRYMAYFKDGNYWRYDFVANRHENLTLLTNKKWEYDLYGTPTLYGIAGWLANGKLLVHSENAVWLLEPGKAKQLTAGNDGKIWRLLDTNPETGSQTYNRSPDTGYDLGKGLVLSWERFNENGIAFLDAKGKLRPLEGGDCNIRTIRQSGTGKLTYIRERFDAPPALMIQSQNGKSNKVFESNKHYQNYQWGRAEPFKFTTVKGSPSKGVLFYPAGYTDGHQYPMIVRSYESLFSKLHRYENPSLYDSSGFNVTHYTVQGYFVMVPDIVFGRNNPGPDVLNSVESAVKAVLQTGMINPDALAYTGHSFGGYQAAYIATHSKIFATVVVGAAITNMVSHYLSVNENIGMPEIFRYENQLWRMDGSLYEKWQDYERNNPIRAMQDVAVPVLVWTGQKDPQVNWRQSVEFYLAGRRLGKKMVFLNYPGEDHALLQKPAQRDLNKRSLEWFDHFLKKKIAAWIEEGVK